ncbi:hypothetical protein [Streptomyces sp. CBMA152]|uniref:hypothetical protein n=1 Tax=Streptomyces sp. CBMA152 TaxID=1896312 RepID=UPI001CB6EEF1|nr:hypothetical protein [Streptomyces sp. CBMA152]MBD0741510.1 hypothetical protein [Streptomyces sp. CBMA152]
MTSTSFPGRPSAADLRRLLDEGGVRCEPGMSERELAAVEEAYGFRFSADHRLLLGAVLPLGPGWPDWRDGRPANLRLQVGLPVQGVLFDVENSGFWPTAWGPKPTQAKHALKSARWHLAKAPRLVPFHVNHYVPESADAWDHPVLSVHRTDVAVRGSDLADYLRREFGTGPQLPLPAQSSTVPFWGDLPEA